MEKQSTMRAAILVVALLLASCMSTPQTASLDSKLPDASKSLVIIEDVPFFPQEEYQCGPAALATLLSFNGDDVSPSTLVDEVYIPGREGSLQLEMLAAARSHGQLAYQINPSLADLLLEVDAGNPILVLQNLGLSIRPQWHFAVVKGYDYAAKEIILNSGTIEDYRLGLKTFERTWSRGHYWAAVIDVPTQVPETATADKYFQSIADFKHSYLDPYATQLAFEAGLRRWPENKQLLLGLGNHFLGLESYQQAADTYSLTVGYYPNYAPALNNLAHTLHQLGENNAALSYALQALENADEFHATYRRTYSDIVHSIEQQVRR